MKSVDVDSEMDEILKETQETNPEGEIPLIQGPLRFPMPKVAVQETLLNLLRQLLYSKNLCQSMVQVVTDRQTLQSFHLSHIPIQIYLR